MTRTLLKLGAGLIFLLCISYVFHSLETQTNKIVLTKPDTPKTVVIVGKLMQGDYWQNVQMGAEAAAKECNVNVKYVAPDSEENVSTQINLIDQSLKEGMDALVYAASDYKKPAEEIAKVTKRHIPVIAIDSEVDSPDVLAFIGTDTYQEGKTAGEKMLELAGHNAKIAIMSSVSGGGNELQKEKGLKDTISRYPEAGIVDIQYCNSNPKLAESLTKKILANHPQINGIVALDVISSVGVANEIKKLKLDNKIKIITFDSSQEELGLVQDGVIQATIIQNPFRMGYLSVKYAVDAMNGINIPKKVDIDTRIIDLDNMFWPENEKLLFPFVS
jgi:ribose transport system substrate-binding protein